MVYSQEVKVLVDGEMTVMEVADEDTSKGKVIC